MRKNAIVTAALSLMFLGSFAGAENLPAKKCQVFIKDVGVGTSSHGSSALTATIKTSWIGNGEMVKQVGFWGKVQTQGLGNYPSCNWTSPYSDNWKMYSSNGSGHDLTYGEVRFIFPVLSGSVTSNCPGFKWTWIGSFFVETDKNTYWVNPFMEDNKNFYFDYDLAEVLMKKGGYSGYNGRGLSTSRDDMKSFNPADCQ